ncbi:MAG: ISAs1 family transposase, partial [Pseudomonadota bacterium]
YLVEDKGADYVFTVKDNQPTLRQDIEILHLDADPPQHTTFDKDHGRIEQRDIWTSTALNEYLDFPCVGQVFLIKRTTTNLVGGLVDGRKTTEEFVVGVTSLSEDKANPVRLLELNRGEWEIENRLHYVRDTTYDEDRSQIRTGNAPQVMAGIRNLSISLLRLAGAECIAVATRYLSRRFELPLRLIGLSGTG